MGKNKLTVDLTEENKKALEKIKTEQHCPYGNTINNLISTFCIIPEEIKVEILAILKQKLKSLYKEMDTAGDFQFKELANQSHIYMNIATFINDGNRIDVDCLMEEPVLKKIALKEGYLLCPDDWIIINPEQAATSLYAGVIECRNASKYHIPHFVFFTNYKYAREYDDCYLKKIDYACVKVYPEFQKIIENQIKPVYDPQHPEQQINTDEWLNAPTIGHFSIYEQGDDMYGQDYEPPAGAKIIRTKTNN